MIDTRNVSETNKTGFNPNVQNAILQPKLKFWMVLMIAFFFIITIGLYGFALLAKRNWFRRMEQQINTSTSNISVQLKQRRDILTKLLSSSKAYMEFEKSTMEEIAKVRALNLSDIKPEQLTVVTSQIDKAIAGFNATFENYPQLKSNEVIIDLMSSADLNEREIAAARRIYNADVNLFNQALFSFPSEAVAAGMISADGGKLHTVALFEASEIDKQDVVFDFNNINK